MTLLEYDDVREQLRAQGRIECPYCGGTRPAGSPYTMRLVSVRMRGGKVRARWRCLECLRELTGACGYQLQLDLEPRGPVTVRTGSDSAGKLPGGASATVDGD